MTLNIPISYRKEETPCYLKSLTGVIQVQSLDVSPRNFFPILPPIHFQVKVFHILSGQSRKLLAAAFLTKVCVTSKLVV